MQDSARHGPPQRPKPHPTKTNTQNETNGAAFRPDRPGRPGAPQNGLREIARFLALTAAARGAAQLLVRGAPRRPSPRKAPALSGVSLPQCPDRGAPGSAI